MRLLLEPVTAVARRVEDMLKDYPEQPLLEQMAEIMSRLLGLPLQAPLKEAMVGLDLLRTRLHSWQQHNASEREGTCLAAQIPPLAQLSARWRRKELTSWRRMVEATLEQQAAAAWVHWFHLFNVLSLHGRCSQASPSSGAAADQGDDAAEREGNARDQRPEGLTTGDGGSLASVLPALEQFMQSSTLCEFDGRLALLRTFEGHCGVTGEASLQTGIGNVARYYAQHAGAVKTELERLLEPVRKEMQDFTKLQRWERTGFTDIQLTTERAQRKLAKVRQQVKAAAARPITPVLARLGNSLGIQLVRSLCKGLSLEAAVEEASALAATREPEQQEAEVSGGVKDEGAVHGKAGDAGGAPGNSGEKGQGQDASANEAGGLDAASRIVEVLVGTGADASPPGLQRGQAKSAAELLVAVQATLRAATAVNRGLLEVVQASGLQAVELWQEDGMRGCRSRRKKALHDFIKALQEQGFSTRRGAVPHDQRTPESWFSVPQIGRLSALPDALPALSSAQQDDMRQAWETSALRLQQATSSMHQLWQRVHEGVHADVSRREAELMTHVSEHLLFVLRSQGSAVAAAQRRLHGVAALLQGLRAVLEGGRGGSVQPCPEQRTCRALTTSMLHCLLTFKAALEDLHSLCPPPGAVEHAALGHALAGAANCLRAKAAVLAAAHSELQSVLTSLPPRTPGSSTAAEGEDVVGGPLRLYTPAVKQVVLSALGALADASAALREAGGQRVHDLPSRYGGESQELQLLFPGWQRTAAELTDQVAELQDLAMAAGIAGAADAAVGGRAAEPAAAGDATQGVGSDRAVQCTAARLAEAVDRARSAVRKCAELWRVKGPRRSTRSSSGEPPGVDGAADAAHSDPVKAAQSLGNLLEAAETVELQGALGCIVECVADGYTVADGSGGVCTAFRTVVQGEWERLRGVLAAASPVLGALWTCMVQLAACSAAHGEATVLSIAVFIAYVMDGFGRGVEEEQDGAAGRGDGTGQGDADECGGTGLGEGDTAGATDVSHLIGDEDEVLGAMTREQQQEQQRQPPDDAGADGGMGEGFEQQAEGIEMAEDFQAEAKDVAGDAAGDDKESGDGDSEEKGAEDLDEQMGDAGEDAEATDAKMGAQDDGDDEGGPRKEDTTKSKVPAEAASGRDTKTVAGDEQAGEDGSDHGSQDGADGTNNQKEASEGEGGELDGEAIAEQARGDDYLQAEKEPGDLELPEDLDLDGLGDANMQNEETGGDETLEGDGVCDSGGESGDDDTGDERGDGAQGDEADDAAQPPGDKGPSVTDGTDEPDPGVDADAAPQPSPAAWNPAAAAQTTGTQGAPSTDPNASDAPSFRGAHPHSGAAQHRPASATLPPAEQQSRQQPPQAPAAAPQADRTTPMEAEDAARDPEPQLPSAAEADGAADGGDGGNERGSVPGAAPPGAQSSGDPEPEDTRPGRRGAEAESNPLRNLGDAHRTWFRRLGIALEDAAQGADVVDSDGSEPEGGDGDDEATQEAACGRFAFEHRERSSGAAQVQASATEEQVKQQGVASEEQGGQAPDMEADNAEQMDWQPQDNAEGGGEKDSEMADARAPTGAQRDPGVRAVRDAGRQDNCNENERGSEWDPLDGAEDADRGDHSRSAAPLPAHGGVGASGGDPEMREAGGDEEGGQELDAAAWEQLLGDRSTDAAGLCTGQERAQLLWAHCCRSVSGAVGELVEQLRLILEPTQATRLSGSYKTGKRLNMRRVIAYVASDYQQDKIWMRRTQPDKRQYDVLLAVDETRSMRENQRARYALEALALLSSALTRLDIGSLGVCAFGGQSGPRMLHTLGSPWTEDAALATVSSLQFDADNTMLNTPVLDMMHAAQQLLLRRQQGGAAAPSEARVSQLLLVLGDGRFHEHEALKRVVRGLSRDDGVCVVFIVLDSKQESVLELKSVVFEDGQPRMKDYLASFPFRYYLVLNQMDQLPHLLADLIRQWLQFVGR